MDYGYLIKRSLEIVRKNRFLWALGVLALFAGGSTGFSGINLNIPSGSSSQDNEVMKSLTNRFSGTSGQSICDALSPYWPVIIFLIFVLIFIGLLFLYLGYSAKAGLIYSANSIEEKEEKQSFGHAFHFGREYFWRLFGLNLLVGLIIFGVFLVSAGVIAGLLFINHSIPMIVLAVILGITAILFLALLGFFLKFGVILAEREIVIKNGRIIASLKTGCRVFRQNISKVLLAWLISVGLAIAYSFVLFFALFVVCLLLVGIGLLFYFLTHLVGVIIYSVVVFLALMIALFCLSGVVNAYFSSYWTLAYRALSKNLTKNTG